MAGAIVVNNLLTKEKREYVGITPRQAVIAAYAQEHNDWNTWDYGKYDQQVLAGDWSYVCGNWQVLKETP
jgi:hypothetical protein